MRRRNWRAALLVTAGAVLLCAGPQAAEPGDIIEIGPGAYPQWSPDGKYLAFVRGGHLIAAPADGTGPETEIAKSRGKRFVWGSNHEIVFASSSKKTGSESPKTIFGHLRFDRVVDSNGKSLGVENISEFARIATITESEAGGKVLGPIVLSDGCVGYEVRSGMMSGTARFVSLDTTRHREGSVHGDARIIILQDGEPVRSPWGQLWLTWYGASSQQRRPLMSNRRCGFPILSPRRDLALVADGSGGSFIIDTLGNVTNPHFGTLRLLQDGRFEEHGRHRWSPDGKRLCYISTISDGHFSEGDRLLLQRADSKVSVELLGADWEIRDSGAWSPQSDRLAVETRKVGIVVVEVGT